jgi:hypothetical protein
MRVAVQWAPAIVPVLPGVVTTRATLNAARWKFDSGNVTHSGFDEQSSGASRIHSAEEVSVLAGVNAREKRR